MPSGTQGRVILSINSNKEKMERKGSKQREQQVSEFLYFRRFYLLGLRLNNVCDDLTKRIKSWTDVCLTNLLTDLVEMPYFAIFP